MHERRLNHELCAAQSILHVFVTCEAGAISIFHNLLLRKVVISFHKYEIHRRSDRQ